MRDRFSLLKRNSKQDNNILGNDRDNLLRDSELNFSQPQKNIGNELEKIPLQENTPIFEEDKKVNILEIDLDDINKSGNLGVETPLIEDDLKSSKLRNIEINGVTIDNSDEKDIKLSLKYTFEHREQVYNSYVKTINNGGLEINIPNILELGDMVRISISLIEIKEQIESDAKVIFISPSVINFNKDDKPLHHYIVQFIGKNALDTEKLLSRYILGYKSR